MEKATVLRQQLGIAEGEPLVSVVEKATADLGLANELEGLNIQQKVDGLIVVAIDTNGIMPAVIQAANAGIPVVAVDAILPDGPHIAQVGVDMIILMKM